MLSLGIKCRQYAYLHRLLIFITVAFVNIKKDQNELKSVYVLGEDLYVDDYAFGDSTSQLTIYVPADSYKDYKNGYGGWHRYKNNIQPMDTVVNIISCSNMELEKGDEFQLAAVNTFGHNITWPSSDESIAEVTQDGLVSVKRNGTVTITAESDNALPFTCIINIVKKKQTVEWNQYFNNIYVGDKLELSVSTSSGLAVEYIITQGSDYAEISDGKLICKAAGEVTVEARQLGNDDYGVAESISKIHLVRH